MMCNEAEYSKALYNFMDNDTLKQLFSMPFKRFKHQPSASRPFKLSNLRTVGETIEKRIENSEKNWSLYKSLHKLGHSLVQIVLRWGAFIGLINQMDPKRQFASEERYF